MGIDVLFTGLVLTFSAQSDISTDSTDFCYIGIKCKQSLRKYIYVYKNI